MGPCFRFWTSEVFERKRKHVLSSNIDSLLKENDNEDSYNEYKMSARIVRKTSELVQYRENYAP